MYAKNPLHFCREPYYRIPQWNMSSIFFFCLYPAKKNLASGPKSGHTTLGHHSGAMDLLLPPGVGEGWDGGKRMRHAARLCSPTLALPQGYSVLVFSPLDKGKTGGYHRKLEDTTEN